MVRALLSMAFVWVMANAAQAALVPVDLYAPGDGLTSHDTETGLQWLDLTQTQGLSFDDVAAGIGGFAADGWRSATASEVCGLIGAHAAAVVPCPSQGFPLTEPTPQIDAFIALLGATMIYPLDTPSGGVEDAFGAVGHFLVSDAQTGMGIVMDQRLTDAIFVIRDRATAVVLNEYATPSYRDYEGGLFLVRPIPEPTSLALLISGLAALAHMRRRP